MANALVTSLGRINNTSTTPLALNTAYDTKYGTYLKLFSGELFKGFQHNTIARDLVMKRTLKNGKSLQFVYTGRMDAAYHVPGEPILGTNNPPVAEKTIVMDDLLISSAFVYDLDETLAHYELRGEISKKIGYALAEKYDRLIFRAITRGARAAHPISATGKLEPGGATVQVGTGTGAAADALDSAKIVAAFFEAAAILDEKGLPATGRVAVLSPRQYYSLIENVSTNALINRDVQGTGLQSGEGVISIAGIQIKKSMNIPFQGKYGTGSATSAGTYKGGSFVGAATEDARSSVNGINNDYGNATSFATSCGLIFQKEAAGVVEAIGPQVQVTSGDVSVIYQGDVILGRLAMGADYLNPAACIELHTTNTAPTAF
jgi:hypothetical protein